MRVPEKGRRSLVGRGSVHHGVTHACHSPWHHLQRSCRTRLGQVPYWQNGQAIVSNRGAVEFASS